MQLQIYRVKNLTVGKKRYILYIPRKRYIQRNLFIYHCGDVSGEVPPVLIPNTVVKLTCADNTWLATVREDRLLLHPKRKHPSLDGCFSFAVTTVSLGPATATLLRPGRGRASEHSKFNSKYTLCTCKFNSLLFLFAKISTTIFARSIKNACVYYGTEWLLLLIGVEL